MKKIKKYFKIIKNDITYLLRSIKDSVCYWWDVIKFVGIVFLTIIAVIVFAVLEKKYGFLAVAVPVITLFTAGLLVSYHKKVIKRI